MGALGKVCEEVPSQRALSSLQHGDGADPRLAVGSSEGGERMKSPCMVAGSVGGTPAGPGGAGRADRQVSGRPWARGLRGWILSSFCGFPSLG